MNYYEILEISEKASNETIKAAYRAIIKKYHPDLVHGKQDEEMTKRINTAYATLIDPELRRKYDAFIRMKKDNERVTPTENARDNYSSASTNKHEGAGAFRYFLATLVVIFAFAVFYIIITKNDYITEGTAVVDSKTAGNQNQLITPSGDNIPASNSKNGGDLLVGHFENQNSVRTAQHDSGQRVVEKYNKYINGRFGYEIDVPEFLGVTREFGNSSGAIFSTEDGLVELQVSGMHNTAGETVDKYYDDLVRRHDRKLGYTHKGHSWCVVTWSNGGKVFYDKIIICSEYVNHFAMSFPEDRVKIYDEMVTHIEQSFVPGWKTKNKIRG